MGLPAHHPTEGEQVNHAEKIALIEKHGKPITNAAIQIALDLKDLVAQVRADGYQDGRADGFDGELHGDLYYVEKIVEAFERGKAAADAAAGTP